MIFFKPVFKKCYQKPICKWALTHFIPLISFYLPLNYVNGLFLYPLETSENHRFSDVSRGYRKRPLT